MDRASHSEKPDQYVPILPRGKHVFQLQFQLPESQLPCSFESKFCTIRYYVKVTLDIPYSSPPQGIKVGSRKSKSSVQTFSNLKALKNLKFTFFSQSSI